MNPSFPPSRRDTAVICRRAFSLIELLAVMAVLGLLVSLTTPALSSLVRGDQLNQSLSEVAGVLDQARQYAIAQNTYVWVAMRSNANTTDGNELNVAVLASKTGTDPSPWTSYGTVPNAQIDLITRPRTFSQIRLENAATFGQDKIPRLPEIDPALSPDNSPSSGTAVFNVKLPGSSAPVSFDRVIQFTPAGEARITASVINMIEFGLRPMRGTTAEQNNVAVVRVNGLTGQTIVYRP